MEKICKNCAHWGNEYDGICEAITPAHAPLAQIVCSADDDQNLNCKLLTADFFGCNLFEERKIS